MDPVHGGGPWTRGPCFVLSPRHAAARGQPKRLAEPELDLVQLLINVDLRELTRALIKENIQAPSLATASISSIGRALRDRFRQKGKLLGRR